MSSKTKNSLLLLTQQLNDIKINLKFLIEESLKNTNNELFVYINPSLKQLIQNPQSKQLLLNDRYKLKQIVNQFYQYSFKLNPNVNVTCLLHNVHQVTKQVKLPYDQILTDFSVEKDRLDNFLTLHLPNRNPSPLRIMTIIPATTPEPIEDLNESDRDLLKQNKVYQNSILGGTFDRLHPGHKILLSESALLTKNQLLIGVSDGELLIRKKLADLIEDFDKRCENVKNFLNIVAPDLKVITTRITDPYGPSITEPDYQCLIVSQETSSGGEAVNKKRLENNLEKLDVHVIDLINDESSQDNSGDEIKVSSSNQRRRLLGTLLKPPYIPYEDGKPYIIGLTGGLASGKSHIVNDLKKMGVACVDSDKLGHKAYVKDTECYKKVVDTFGSDILDESGDINRKELGKKVFNSPSELKKLTDIVWPEIRRLRDLEIKELYEKGNKIIVVEAAVMIEAKWNDNVNEIWVVFVSEEEAIKRAMQRDGSTLEKVKQTLSSQLSNKEKLKYANVAFCSLWEREYTIKQVNKAWDLLLKRTLNKS